MRGDANRLHHTHYKRWIPVQSVWQTAPTAYTTWVCARRALAAAVAEELLTSRDQGDAMVRRMGCSAAVKIQISDGSGYCSEAPPMRILLLLLHCDFSVSALKQRQQQQQQYQLTVGRANPEQTVWSRAALSRPARLTWLISYNPRWRHRWHGWQLWQKRTDVCGREETCAVTRRLRRRNRLRNSNNASIYVYRTDHWFMSLSKGWEIIIISFFIIARNCCCNMQPVTKLLTSKRVNALDLPDLVSCSSHVTRIKMQLFYWNSLFVCLVKK